MKEDQLPDCYVQANDDYYVCYVIEYDDEEHMDIDEKYLDNGLVEIERQQCLGFGIQLFHELCFSRILF